MKSSYLIAACAVLLAAVGIAIAQQQAFPSPVPPPSLVQGPPNVTAGPTLTFPNDPFVPASAASTPPAAKLEDFTIEQLIETMEKTRAEIVEREKKNQAMLKVLQEKVGKVKVRMDSFSGNALPVAPGLPPLPGKTAPIPGPSTPPAKP